MTRRAACTLLALAPAAALAKPRADTVPAELEGLFALKRRAYQSGDAELLRGFYASSVAIVGEGMPPLLGLEPVLNAYRALLPKRRDIAVEPLRSQVSADGSMAAQFVRFTAYSRDPAETIPPVTFLFHFERQSMGLRCVVELLLRQDLGKLPGFLTTTNG